MKEYWREKFPVDYQKLDSRLKSNNEEITVRALKDLGNLNNLPETTQQLVISLNSSNNSNIANNAVIYTKKCTDLFEHARTSLLKAIKSKHWFIRANAAESLAYLGVKDEIAIDAICSLIGDTLGHDFNGHESAITALGYIGEAAKKSIPQILEWCHSEIDNKKNRVRYRIDLIFENVAKIDATNQFFYQTLIKAFHTLDPDLNTNIIRHLSAFGNHSLEILSKLQPYVEMTEYLDDEYFNHESAELSLLKSLLKIEGRDGENLKKYLKNLKASPHRDWQKIAALFEKDFFICLDFNL